jgi:hypothetical protein
MATTWRAPHWEVAVDVEQINTTSSFPSADPGWRFTDAAGHEHRYDRGYPSLRYVVDESHWCDGTEGTALHDPHEAVDEAHYECLACHEVVEVGLLPAGYPQWTPGNVTATLKGHRSDGTWIEAVLTPSEVDALRAAGEDQQAAQQVIDAIPLQRTLRVTQYSR